MEYSVNINSVLIPPSGGRNKHEAEAKTEEVLCCRLREGISGLLSQWNALQMAVQNQWGGSDSLHKSHQLAADILTWFSQSKTPVSMEDLESLLHEKLLFTFKTDIEDGSIEEVAEQLMIMHEEYLRGNH
ncbi:uncharacterized protein LOC132273138 [Cornus florida]|uniref:uncharacterized protein LOC132273138 n=1 Tax=Cornus florida TaxID=4283 RepID=UPI0028A00F50|nr:uncharacterized protein LOC132273138 [Cornus florida]